MTEINNATAVRTAERAGERREEEGKRCTVSFYLRRSHQTRRRGRRRGRRKRGSQFCGWRNGRDFFPSLPSVHRRREEGITKYPYRCKFEQPLSPRHAVAFLILLIATSSRASQNVIRASSYDMRRSGYELVRAQRRPFLTAEKRPQKDRRRRRFRLGRNKNRSRRIRALTQSSSFHSHLSIHLPATPLRRPTCLARPPAGLPDNKGR